MVRVELERTLVTVGKKPLPNPKPIKASAGDMLESLVENIDRPPNAQAVVLEAIAGTYTGRLSAGASARATTAEAGAHAGPAEARARGPTVSAGVHAGVASVGAMASAEVCRAEASVAGVGVAIGLQADKGVKIGVDGLEANFLGFGVRLGPQLKVKTPVAEATCSIM